MDLILFHNACPDGFTAAYIASLKYPEAELQALDHGLTDAQIDELVAKATGKDVLMLDYSLRTRENNDRLVATAKSFQVYDHHKTAQATLEGAPYAIFDMDRSGAGLAWDYLFGKDSDFKPLPYGDVWSDVYPPERPWWVNYTEARDLWRWDSLPNSRQICAYLGTLPFTKEAYGGLAYISEEQATRLGEGALAHIQHFVRETVKNAREGILFAPKNGVTYPWGVKILNATYLNCSEIGNELAKTAEISLTWFERKDDVIQFSLRSIGSNDVSEIAKSFGGGGHANAAGFQMAVTEGRRLIDIILGRTVSVVGNVTN